jgi:hypothetical protein
MKVEGERYTDVCEDNEPEMLKMHTGLYNAELMWQNQHQDLRNMKS